jgi:integrase
MFKILGRNEMKFKELLDRVYPKGVNPNLMEEFGERHLREIMPLLVEDYKQRRVTKVSHASVNRELAALRHALNLAVTWGLIEKNPCTGVKLFREKPRMKWLKEEDEGKLLKASPEWLRPIILIAVYTGMRSGEILALTWNDVDLEQKTILIVYSKNGESRVVELNQVVLDLLLGLSKGKKPHEKLFPKRDTYQISKAFRKACAVAGLDGMRFHDLRHTFASRLCQRGVNLPTIKELLGHKSLTMALRYSHSTTESRRQAVEKLTCPNYVKLASVATSETSTDFGSEPLAQSVEQLTLNQ